MPTDLRRDILDAEAWHNQPMPDAAELQPLTEGLALLRETVRNVIRAQEEENVPADVLENKCRQANKDVDKQALNWLARGKLPAFLHAKFGLERLPEDRYWLAADGGATREAKLALTTGETLPSEQDPRVRGVVKVRILDFRLCAGGYLAERGLAELPFMASWPAWPFEHRRTGRGTVDGKADPDRKRHRDAGETPRRN